MAEISRLSRLLNGVQRGIDLSTNTLVVQDLKLNGTLLSTTLNTLNSAISAAQADATQALADAAAAQSDATQALADAAAAQSAADDAQADATQALSDAAAAQSTANSAQSDATSALGKSGHLVTLSGRPADSDDLGTFTGAIIPDASTIKAALQSLESSIEGLPDPLVYKGVWNATTNSPALDNDDTAKAGWLYQVTVAGTVDFGAGDIDFEVGDKVVNNGTVWEKWDMTDAVTSVNGQSGAVSLDTDDISEGSTNKYFTSARAKAAAVADAISDGVTDVAPSQNAVFDALALKLNTSAFGSSFDTALATKSTSNLAEGSNLYFTDARAQAAVTSTPKGLRSVVAGEAMAADTSWAVRWAVSGETAGRVYKADNDASSANKFYVWGIALKTSSIAVAASVDVVFEGEYTLGSSDTPFASGDVGKPVYLGAAGALTVTAPTATDTAVYRVGIVMATNKIWVGDKQLNGIN